MVVTFDFQPIEIEAGRHAADAVVALIDINLMAKFEQIHRRHQAHRAGTEYGITRVLTHVVCPVIPS